MQRPRLPAMTAAGRAGTHAHGPSPGRFPVAPPRRDRRRSLPFPDSPPAASRRNRPWKEDTL